jgi:hypothetical protein
MTIDGLETDVRTSDLALARIHLRMGSLGLARAELEAIAGQDALDVEGLLDLAEVRWRTGDLPGAGDAAQAYLASGGDEALGFVVAAEAVAAVGRPTEARRLAAEAIDRAQVSLDALFAGMPRSLIWPADASDDGQPAGTLFEPVTGPAAGVEPAADPAPAPDPGATARGAGFWDADDARGARSVEMPRPDGELEAARAAMAAGDLESAALHLAVVLRIAPSLAPAVLDAASIGPSGASNPALEIVRGDAYRLVGHEADAQRAYASAAELAGDRRPGDSR